MTNQQLITKAIERLEAHYPYEDESGIIKISLGKYMNAMQELRQLKESINNEKNNKEEIS